MTIFWGQKYHTGGNSTFVTIPITMSTSILQIQCWMHGSSVTEDGDGKTRYGTWVIQSKSTFQCGMYDKRTTHYIGIGS